MDLPTFLIRYLREQEAVEIIFIPFYYKNKCVQKL